MKLWWLYMYLKKVLLHSSHIHTQRCSKRSLKASERHIHAHTMEWWLYLEKNKCFYIARISTQKRCSRRFEKTHTCILNGISTQTSAERHKAHEYTMKWWLSLEKNKCSVLHSAHIHTKRCSKGSLKGTYITCIHNGMVIVQKRHEDSDQLEHNSCVEQKHGECRTHCW
jgi:hypothetical protein